MTRPDMTRRHSATRMERVQVLQVDEIAK